MISPIKKYNLNEVNKKITIYNQDEKLYEKYVFSAQREFPIRDFR